MLSQPHPLSEFRLNPLPPHPPQQESKRIIQIIELHPHPLLAVAVPHPHPHPVAVKSLMILPPKGFLFYGLSYVYGLYVLLYISMYFKKLLEKCKRLC